METTIDVAAPACLVRCPHCGKSRSETEFARVAEIRFDYRLGRDNKTYFLVCADTCAKGYDINLAIAELQRKQRAMQRRRAC